MKKRILILAEYYLPGYCAGGPVRSLSNLVNALAEDFDWRVLTRDRDLLDSKPYAAVPIGQWVTVGPAQVYYAAPTDLGPMALWSQLRKMRPDLLYLNSFFSPRFSLWPTLAAWLGLLTGTALLVAPRGEFSPGALGIKPRRKKAFMALSQLLGLHARVAWHASTLEEAEDIRRALGRRTATIHVAKNLGAMPAAAPEVDPGAQTVGHSRRPVALRVCFLSRVSRMKNLDYALKVLAQVRVPVHFTIYGPQEDPAYWAECEALMAALPRHVSVEVAGAIPHEQVHRRLSAHDLFFLPTRGENYGHVLAEALSAGLTLLTSDQSPWRQLPELGLGHDLPLSDPAAFARVIDTMAGEMAEQRAARRQRCMTYARRLLQDDASLQAHRQMFAVTVGPKLRRP